MNPLWMTPMAALALGACMMNSGKSASNQSSSVALSSSSWNVKYDTSLRSSEWSGEFFTDGIEGPAADKSGQVYAVNMDDPEGLNQLNTIGKVTADGKPVIVARLADGSTANGLRINHAGTVLYAADYTAHKILKIQIADGSVSTWVDEPRMSQPNDLAITADDGLYASDPDWGKNSGAIWYVSPSGKTTKVDSAVGTTNGIELSPDGKTLYVGESVQRKIWAYDVQNDGSLSGRRLFYSFDDFGLDGMRCDAAGALYVTRYGKGTIEVISAQGQKLQEIQTQGKYPNNLTFGGPDGRDVFVTVRDSRKIEKFRANVPGREWILSKP